MSSARVVDTIEKGKGRGYGAAVRKSIGRGNAVPDKRERQSRAISKRPITGERSELEGKKLHEENRDSFGVEEEGDGEGGGHESSKGGWDEMEN